MIFFFTMKVIFTAVILIASAVNARKFLRSSSFVGMNKSKLLFSEFYNSCVNPNKVSGLCRPFRSCQSLVDILQKNPNDQQFINFLRQSQCGYSGSDPNVCCPNTAIPTPEPITQNRGGPVAPGSKLPKAPDCGIDTFTDKIFGGEETKVDEYTWLVQLQYSKRESHYGYW